MRLCAQCGAEDKPWYVDAACTCGSERRDAELPPAERHAPNCRCVEHEVVQFPVRMARQDLSFGADGKPQLSMRHKRDGWTLLQDGPKFYRVKLLCRNCIGKQEEIAARQREYKQCCKAAQGVETKSYAQMLASQ